MKFSKITVLEFRVKISNYMAFKKRLVIEVSGTTYNI